MKPETKRILNDPGLEAARDEWFARLGALFTGEALCAREAFGANEASLAGDDPGGAFYLEGIAPSPACPPYEEPERAVHEVLDRLASSADGLRSRREFRPLVVEFGVFGVHYVDRLFGAEVFPLDGNEGNWQTRPLSSPVGTLRPVELGSLESPGGVETWELSRRIALAFVEAGVSVPLFAMPTIASALNVGVNLLGERLLAAMLVEREAAARDLGVINDTLCSLHRWYRRAIPERQLQPVVAASRAQPPGFGQICGCSTQLVSPGLYADLVAPLDEELLSVHPNGGMIHLCGEHLHLAPALRRMGPLRAVQLNDRAAEDLGGYVESLREDQVVYCNPCGGMPVEGILEVAGGRRLVIPARRP